jgi:DNA helicase II / ATP-dependent DNA helicase PcrA
MHELLRGLNAEQKRAVTTTEGPLLVLAGAGSGKTRVITVRIAWLLAHKVLPENVLAMTFTNKAASEMRERIGALVGKQRAKELTVGTFHAFCVRVLRAHGAAIGLARNFTICDSSDQLAALKGALRELRIGEAAIQPGLLQAKISLAKNRLQTPATLLAAAGDDQDELVARAWAKYDEHLARARTLDYDDLLLRALELLAPGSPVRAELARRYRYVLVDEYQDTNGPQYEIVRAIAGEHRNLCVVGDDDQSIYGWRGADVSKILGFEKDFAKAAVVRLETNYRSTEEILAAANAVIAHNPSRHGKTLRSALGKGDPVRILRAEDETGEADWVALDVQELVRKREAKLADCAVLFRSNTQPRVFEAQFRARAIPYVLIGGMSFFDRKEVRDVLAYLRLAANPHDEVSFLRVVNCPPRGIGKATIDRALEFATEQGIGVVEAFGRAREVEGLAPAAVEAVLSFTGKMTRLGAADPGRRLVGWIRELLLAVDYRSEVDRAYADPKQREDRWMGVLEVVNFAENHVRKEKDPGLASFLEALTLSSEGDRFEDDGAKGRDVVTLMTLHAAKGLEFPRVYLVGVEEGILPHARSVVEDTIEEERRLMYVGITRAQRQLAITMTKSRAKYGTRVESMPSRFLFEMRGEKPPKGWVAAGAKEAVREADEPKKRARAGAVPPAEAAQAKRRARTAKRGS